MAKYLHTMLRITDPAKSKSFYEALGMEFRRESPIVRGGELEATIYFFGYPGQDEELELTLNADGRAYELGTAYGHIAVAVDDLAATLGRAPRARHRRRARALPGPRGRRTDRVRQGSRRRTGSS